ncbi:ABC transporter ATP-binding protein [Bifidobacterium samirii]|uniref:Peptide ABC transporter ATPase n=1 Tax=Bifidobacterium samirii TaxID=2306974 RepID=A0A430FWR0_9BIFI|nr:ATP-binding cassette domain-containing protein [Bifidobacterium samirii]RSX58479.1 peptide ABC transporter ATPase [Bifidobacterium samirii]
MTTLEMRDVTKRFDLRDGLRTTKFTAVSHASFTLESGRTVALVGQSGSGKSTIAKMILGLEKPTEGTLLIDGRPVEHGRKADHIFRKTVQMVFQDPYASLNPFHTVEHHIARPMKLHHPGMSDKEVHRRVVELLDRVRLTPGEEFAKRLPGELSGGQRQRVAIARALAPEPKILIADEPVSALDVSIRLGVLNLLARLQREENLGVLYITHDMATARHFSDEIMVMRKGEIVERGPADDVILHPQAEYTRTLIGAAPDPERRLRELMERRASV